MTLRFAVAIVLAVLVLVCIVLARLAFKRWKYPPKPRRRDSDPAWLQVRRQWAADLKRCRRGLRFPSVHERKRHLKWRHAFLTDPVGMVQRVAGQITQLKAAGVAA